MSYKYPQSSPTPYENIPTHTCTLFLPDSQPPGAIRCAFPVAAVIIAENLELYESWSSTVVCFLSHNSKHEHRKGSPEVAENAAMVLTLNIISSMCEQWNGMEI